MAFNDLTFLYLFLPLAMMFYFVFPRRFRNVPLVIISLVFYAWGSPVYTLLLMLSILLNYFAALEIDAHRSEGEKGRAKAALVLIVSADVLLLGIYKYSGFLVENINALLNLSLQKPNVSLPLGISFYTFSALSYVFDVYGERAPVQKNIIKLAVYVAFFPKVISGPITAYRDMWEQLDYRKTSFPKFGEGLNMFLVGLAKKVLLADNFGTAFSAISNLEQMSAGTAWLGMVLYSLQLYFDFSGYSDMAVGLGKMLGFELGKNFDYPYRAESVSDFWRRWHITLGAWFREYIYFPLGGSRCSRGRGIRNLAIVWLLTGLWHGAAWNFVAWGLWHGFFVILEKYPLRHILKKFPHWVRVGLTLLEVFLGWVLFFSPSLGDAVVYYGQMLGSDGLGVFDSVFRYYFFSNLVLLVFAAVGSGPLPKKLHRRLAYQRGDAATYVSVGLYLLLLLLCTAGIVNSTYSSFLYFQF